MHGIGIATLVLLLQLVRKKRTSRSRSCYFTPNLDRFIRSSRDESRTGLIKHRTKDSLLRV